MSEEPKSSAAAEKPPEETSRPPLRKWRVFWGTIGLGLVMVALFCACFWKDVFVVAADQWIVDEPFAQADAVFVLAGSANDRALRAVRYYDTGRVPLILHARGRLRQSDMMKQTIPDYFLMRRLVRFAGVPDKALITVGTNCTSTYEEAMAFRDWARTNNIDSVVIPTGHFHARRVRWTFDRALAGTDIKVYVRSIPSIYYEHDEWWRNEHGMITFQNEFVKYWYYRLRY